MFSERKLKTIYTFSVDSAKIVFGSLVVGVFIPGSLGAVSWVTFSGGIITTSFLLVLALILSDKIKTISL